MRVKSKEKGRLGEEAACRFLKDAGYRIVERNYRCPIGEMDIVAWDGDTMVFVEVKCSTTSDPIPPKYRIDIHKKRKLTRLAHLYMKQKSLECQSARFDVVQVLLGQDGSVKVDLIKDAFEEC
jgi:putative endonuclease